MDNSMIPENLPKEAKQKLEKIKKKLDQFKDKAVKKHDKKIMGIALLPPDKQEEGKPPSENINVLVLVDDNDSKTSKLELRDKIAKDMEEMATKVDKNLKIETLLLTELWQNCYDGKMEILQKIAMGAIVHDTGMLSAVKIAEVHKTMVLKKFEKYIVSYVLAGSLVQGRATPESDIDVFVVIDDTDVKKMTRAELKDKLRAIIVGMGMEAGEITGIKNKINIQVYILTDFWDNIKEANPIIFTFLRDGIPFYDRGIFMPWKQLLFMGRIKPSPEAIDMFMSSGDQMLKRVQLKFNEIGMEDIFYAILTPSQAALMLYGLPPPTPKETPEILREIFVKKEKILEDKYVKTLEEVINLRKTLEHGSNKKVTGKQIDELLEKADDYLKRINKLFSQIDRKKADDQILHTYESAITVIRDTFKLYGIDDITEDTALDMFEKHLIAKGHIPQKYLRILKEIVQAKEDYEKKKLTKTEVNQVRKEYRDFMKVMVEHIQRIRSKEMAKTKIRVKHGDKYGEVILLGDKAFIIHDIDNEEKGLSKATITKDGKLKDVKEANIEELESELVKISIPPKVFVKQPLFEDLKDIYGKDVEILLNY